MHLDVGQHGYKGSIGSHAFARKDADLHRSTRKQGGWSLCVPSGCHQPALIFHAGSDVVEEVIEVSVRVANGELAQTPWLVTGHLGYVCA